MQFFSILLQELEILIEFNQYQHWNIAGSQLSWGPHVHKHKTGSN